jgi:hypothetical protein
MEDLEIYVETFVEPVIADFAANRASVRHAFVPCLVTFHAVDHLAHPRNAKGLRQQW